MDRRQFVGALGAAAAAGSIVRPALPELATDWRKYFPALRQRVNDRALIYLDTAATSLRPTSVIQAIAGFYAHENANPGSALHTLARRSALLYDDARRTVAEFINANEPAEIVFTRGTTDGINLVASAWGQDHLGPGDQVLIGIAEHASNMVPWQLIAKKTGAEVRYFGVDDVGHPDLDDLESRLTPKTKVVAFSHVSNVLGMINPAKAMCDRIRASGTGRIVVIDAAQSAPHFPVDVRSLGCDFLAFSGHKMLGPMGIGVLWGRRDLLDAMSPYQGGSNMAHDVDLDGMHLSDAALKFGAGTPNVAGAVGLAAAMRFIRGIGHGALWQHEQSITRLALDRLSTIPGVRVLGENRAEERISVFAFTVRGRQPSDVLRRLDARGIAVRAGDLASLPLLKRMGTTGAVRASCYLYTTKEEIELLAKALSE